MENVDPANKGVGTTQGHVTQLPSPGQRPVVVVYQNGRWESVFKDAYEPDHFPISNKMIITPEWAREVMIHRNRSNRPINMKRVLKYARDIVAGNYQVINNGIGFYEDGTLADAQHRLTAIAQANIPVVSFVVFGLTRKAGKAIDDGRPRTDRDIAHLSGLELSTSFVSAANYIIELMGGSATRGEKLAFYELHKDAINFAANGVTKKYVCRAPILAVIARAWYTQDRKRLIDFMDILQTGKVPNEHEDDGAFRIREFAIDNGARNDGPFRLKLYNKTESALRDFLLRKPLDRLAGTKEELYLLPEEIQQRKEQTFINRSEAMKAVREREKKHQRTRGQRDEENTEPRAPESYGG